MKSILQTQPGERVMQPSYGADQVTFEPMNPDRVEFMVREAILDHEPRVDSNQLLIDVNEGDRPGELIVQVTYTGLGEVNPRVLTQGYFSGPATTRPDGSAG